MNTDLDKSYSPCSEGYSSVTTRYRDQLHRWIEDQDGEIDGETYSRAMMELTTSAQE